MGAWLQRKARWQPLVLVAISPECKWRFCCRVFALYTCQNHCLADQAPNSGIQPARLPSSASSTSVFPYTISVLALELPCCAGVGVSHVRQEGQWIDNDKDPIAGFRKE